MIGDRDRPSNAEANRPSLLILGARISAVSSAEQPSSSQPRLMARSVSDSAVRSRTCAAPRNATEVLRQLVRPSTGTIREGEAAVFMMDGESSGRGLVLAVLAAQFGAELLVFFCFFRFFSCVHLRKPSSSLFLSSFLTCRFLRLAPCIYYTQCY